MKLVHLADCHLGFRGYHKTSVAGINQREVDVARAFSRVIGQAIAIAPDIVVIAGDLFHAVRPSNHTTIHAAREFARLVTALPDAIVIVVAGNHDAPHGAEIGCILPLFEMFGVHVVDREAKRLSFPDRGLSVMCVPDVPGIQRPALIPDPNARFNVLVLHGEVKGALPARTEHDKPAIEIEHEEINTPGAKPWDYVALGHYHAYRELAPNMFYAGSMDYTSTNVWGELAEERAAGRAGKGFAERNLITGEQTFHPIVSSRLFADLTIDADGMIPSELDDAIAAAVATIDLDGGVVRIVVHEVTRAILRELNHKQLKSYRFRALHWNLDCRRPEDRVPGFLFGNQPEVGIVDHPPAPMFFGDRPDEPRRDWHGEALLEADMRAMYGDEDAPFPHDPECSDSLEHATAFIAANVDPTDPYGLDQYPPRVFSPEELYPTWQTSQ